MDIYIVFGALAIVGGVVLGLVVQRRRNAAWQQFASDIGGEFVKGGLFKVSAVRARAGEANVTIDTYSVPSGDSNTEYTRITAPFENRDGFQFRIQRRGLLGRIDKALGTKHIDTGDPEFDRDFMVQSNNEFKIQSLLLDQNLRSQLHEQKSLDLMLKDNLLRLEVTGTVRDPSRLKALYTLFGMVFQKL